MKKFDWKARESAPTGFPMRVVEGNFYDKEGGSLYIPDKRTIHHGWGEGVSSHVVGPDKKNLPDRFDITCFSYTEDVFYEGSFELPYDHILQLFSRGYYSPKIGEKITYDSLVVGIAPGGYVTVWATGIDKKTEVFTDNMKKADIPWQRVLDNPNVTRKEFITSVLKESLDENEYKRILENKIPFGQWETYAKRYKWQPMITGVKAPDIITEIEFVNGEKDYYSPSHDNAWEDRMFAIPKKMTFVWTNVKNLSITAELIFNSEDIFSAFQEISQKTANIFYLTVDIRTDGGGHYYTVALISGNEKILIKNTRIRHF